MTPDPGTRADTQSPAARLAAEIRVRRKAAGLSHADLAQRIGYTREYVSQAERVRRGLPSAVLVSAIDHALGADGVLTKLRVEADAARKGRRAVEKNDQLERSNPAALVSDDGIPQIPVVVDGHAVLVPLATAFSAGGLGVFLPR